MAASGHPAESTNPRLRRVCRLGAWAKQNPVWCLLVVLGVATLPLTVAAQERALPVRPSPEQHAPPVNTTKTDRVEIAKPEERPVGEEAVAERATNGKVGRIKCTLILATNPDKPKAPDPEMAKIARKIEKIFGYKQIEVVGTDKAAEDHYEHWLVPSQDFWLSVKSKREEEGMYFLDLHIYHNRRRIVETEAKLGPDSPLLIRGPLCAKGQLVVALQIVP
jgi:hypothetical protein